MSLLHIKSLCATQNALGVPEYIDGMPWNQPWKHDLTPLTKRQLVAMCCLYVPYNSKIRKMTKAQIVCLITVLTKIKKIQRRVRKKQRMKRAMNPVCENNKCFFTQDEFDKPVFVRTNSTGYKRGFSVDILVSYLHSCGKVFDPVDKEPFTKYELGQIDTMIDDFKLDNKHVSILLTEESKNAYSEAKRQREAIHIIQEDIRADAAYFHIDMTRVDNFNFVCFNDYNSFCDFRSGCMSLCRIDVDMFMEFVHPLIAEITDSDGSSTPLFKTFIKRTLTSVALDAVEVAWTTQPPAQPMDLEHDDDDDDDDDDDYEEPAESVTLAAFQPLFEAIAANTIVSSTPSPINASQIVLNPLLNRDGSNYMLSFPGTSVGVFSVPVRAFNIQSIFAEGRHHHTNVFSEESLFSG
jgi:hypothetical protein